MHFINNLCEKRGKHIIKQLFSILVFLYYLKISYIFVQNLIYSLITLKFTKYLVISCCLLIYLFLSPKKYKKFHIIIIIILKKFVFIVIIKPGFC